MRRFQLQAATSRMDRKGRNIRRHRLSPLWPPQDRPRYRMQVSDRYIIVFECSIEHFHAVTCQDRRHQRDSQFILTPISRSAEKRTGAVTIEEISRIVTYMQRCTGTSSSSAMKGCRGELLSRRHSCSALPIPDQTVTLVRISKTVKWKWKHGHR